MSEPRTLMEAWAKYATEVLEQPALALTDEMIAFMAGASCTVMLMHDAAHEAADGDVSPLMNSLLEEVESFAEFMSERHQDAAE